MLLLLTAAGIDDPRARMIDTVTCDEDKLRVKAAAFVVKLSIKMHAAVLLALLLCPVHCLDVYAT